jgi:hypothetical protein
LSFTSARFFLPTPTFCTNGDFPQPSSESLSSSDELSSLDVTWRRFNTSSDWAGRDVDEPVLMACGGDGDLLILRLTDDLCDDSPLRGTVPLESSLSRD